MTTTRDRVRAAIATLPGAIVAHEAAAELHGLLYVERGLATVLVHTQTTHEFPGVIVRRTHDLETEHVVSYQELPVTTVPRTIVDLAGIVSQKNLAVILDDAAAAQVVSMEAVAEVATTVGRSGKPGTKSLREVLEERLGSDLKGSDLERRGNELVLGVGIGQPEFEYAIPWRPDHRFDAAFPADQLAVEWDSKRWHTQVSAFDRDRARDREAILHGWRVLRFTWADVTERPEQVVATIRKAVERDHS